MSNDSNSEDDVLSEYLQRIEILKTAQSRTLQSINDSEDDLLSKYLQRIEILKTAQSRTLQSINDLYCKTITVHGNKHEDSEADSDKSSVANKFVRTFKMNVNSSAESDSDDNFQRQSRTIDLCNASCQQRNPFRDLDAYEQNSRITDLNGNDRKYLPNRVSSVRFRANPLPKAILKPMYEQMLKDQRVKSAENRRKRAEKILSSVKPFSFDSTRLHRTLSAPVLSDEKDLNRLCFKANPVPKHILNDAVRCKMNQEEEFRKLKKKIRAEEMLRSSVSPVPNRSNISSYGNGKFKEEMNQENETPAAKKLPNFRALHFKLAKDLGNDKIKNFHTVCKSFNLSSQGPSHLKGKPQLTKGLIAEWCSNSPVKKNNILRSGSPIPPAKMNNTVQLRNSLKSAKLVQPETMDQYSSQANQELKAWTRKIAINNRIMDNCNLFEKRNLELRRALSERQKDYNNELKEMKSRVAARPLLMERQALENAKLAAEKRFRQKLQSNGLSELQIQERCISLRKKFDGGTTSKLRHENDSSQTVTHSNNDEGDDDDDDDEDEH
ncbi:Uncharacterised protein g4935 [Pycnogonum litorale]